MKKTKVDLVLHPIRMRILMALVGKEMSAQQLADVLHDVPQATLYRHINRLAKAGVIIVVEERQVRGTVEKIYTLDVRAAQMGPEEMANLSREDHMRYFIAFVATLLDDFSRYLQSSPELDLAADGVGYHKILLELSDEEFREFNTTLNAALRPFLHNEPAPGRRRRILSTIAMPDADEIPARDQSGQ